MMLARVMVIGNVMGLACVMLLDCVIVLARVMSPLRGSQFLSAGRVGRTMASGRKGLQLEVGPRIGP